VGGGSLRRAASGRAAQIGDDVAEVVRQTLETTPRDATHWTLCSMAKAAGFAQIDDSSDLEGLQSSAPSHRDVQALPTLYLSRRRAIAHGAFLFTALDAATGKVIGRCYPRHRGREFLSFLREIERHVPPELEASLIMDNDATHKTPTIRKWLGARPRSRVHLTRPPALGWTRSSASSPTSLKKQIRRDVHRSTEELETAIRSYIEAVDNDPKPFRWTKSADNILANIKRFCLKPLEIAAAQTEIARNSESGR
jgi:hypothetical protein